MSNPKQQFPTPLEILIDYHNDMHWGLNNDIITDREFHTLTRKQQSRDKTSYCLTGIHPSEPEWYWALALENNIKRPRIIQRNEIIAKLKLHATTLGCLPYELLEKRNEYFLKLMSVASITVLDHEIIARRLYRTKGCTK